MDTFPFWFYPYYFILVLFWWAEWIFPSWEKSAYTAWMSLPSSSKRIASWPSLGVCCSNPELYLMRCNQSFYILTLRATSFPYYLFPLCYHGVTGKNQWFISFLWLSIFKNNPWVTGRVKIAAGEMSTQ